MAKRKTWREKLADAKGLPRIGCRHETYSRICRLRGDKVAVEAGGHAARQLQDRGGLAGDVLGVEDQQFAGVGRREKIRAMT